MKPENTLLNFIPKYCITLPISNKNVNYRPYVVGEEKKILLTKMSTNKKEILMCIKQIIENCFYIPDISEYDIADVEYMMLLMRAKSAGETEPFKIKCPYTEEIAHFTVSILDNIVIDFKETPETIKIQLNKTTSIVLERPKFKHLIKIPEYDKGIDNFYNFVASCVLQINTNKSIKHSKDVSDTEILQLIKKIKIKQFKKIIDFFDKTPSLYVIGNYRLKNQEIKEVKMKGILNLLNLFFDYINPFNYYKLSFQMKYYHHFSLEEIESLIPWERQIYVEQIKKYLEEKENNK